MLAVHGKEISKKSEEYNRTAKDLKDMENRESFEILKSADVIAMTTTGAAKYRDLIYNLPVSVKPYNEIYFCAYSEFFLYNLNLAHCFVVVFVLIYPPMTGQHKTLTIGRSTHFLLQ